MLEYIFVTPLEYAAKALYLLIYNLTSNYGISLLILSVISNLLMIAAIKAVSRFADRETKIQKILQPQILKIKQESRGEEKHRRITRLYKRYSYHPIYNLRAAIPVFVQLPFLFAAYIMFSRLEAINGVSFLFIGNLKEPDAILAGINLLPFVMTAVNIITALITKDFTLKEKLQANVIAILFLVLLYGAPSALLLFWTTNNVLLLVRTLVKQRN